MLRMDGQMGKMSRFNTRQKWEKTMKQSYKIGGAHIQSVNNHYAKFERNEYCWSYRLHKLGTP